MTTTRQPTCIKQSFMGSAADKLVQNQKWKAQQSNRPKIYCSNNALDNVYLFTYLGPSSLRMDSNVSTSRPEYQ